MARYQGGVRLDFTDGKFMKSTTKETLSSIDWAIAQSIDAPKTADEFTVAEYAERAGLGMSQAFNRLKRMKGVTSRLVTLSGSKTRLYRRA